MLEVWIEEPVLQDEMAGFDLTNPVRIESVAIPQVGDSVSLFGVNDLVCTEVMWAMDGGEVLCPSISVGRAPPAGAEVAKGVWDPPASIAAPATLVEHMNREWVCNTGTDALRAVLDVATRPDLKPHQEEQRQAWIRDALRTIIAGGSVKAPARPGDEYKVDQTRELEKILEVMQWATDSSQGRARQMAWVDENLRRVIGGAPVNMPERTVNYGK